MDRWTDGQMDRWTGVSGLSFPITPRRPGASFNWFAFAHPHSMFAFGLRRIHRGAGHLLCVNMRHIHSERWAEMRRERVGGQAESASVPFQTREEYNKWLLSGILIYFSIHLDEFRIPAAPARLSSFLRHTSHLIHRFLFF